MESPSTLEIYKGYLTHKELLAKHEFETSRDCDKWTLTTAGSALALSFTFLKDIVNLSVADHKWFLIAGWVAAVLAIVASLASLHLGELAHRRFGECLDNAAAGGFDVGYWTRVRKEQGKSWLAPLTSWFSRFALAFTILGLVGLLSFVYVNLKNSGVPNGKAITAPQPVAPTATPTPTATTGK